MQPSKSTRRQFLVSCSAIAVTASMVPAALAAPAWARDVALDRIKVMDFALQLDTAFSVRRGNATSIELLLIEFEPLDESKQALPNAADAQNEKFALLFRGPLAQPLTQDTYEFEHPRIGRFAMFIVPVGCTDQSHCYYEAIFNRPPHGPEGRPARIRPTKVNQRP